MKKVFKLILPLFVVAVSVVELNAQGTIGSEEDPPEGVVLYLKSNGKQGMVFPQANLSAAGTWGLDGNAIEGMAVYNISDNLEGPGMYIWVSNGWSKMGASAKPCVQVLLETAMETQIFDNPDQTLTVQVVAGSAPYHIEWTQGGAPVRTILNTSNGLATLQTTEYGTYECNVMNACTQTPEKIVFRLREGGSEYNLLRGMIALALLYLSDNYTPASWGEFELALLNAQTVYANLDATKEEMANARILLNNKISQLERKANKSALSAAITMAQNILDDIDKYVPETVVGLAEALDAAQLVFDDGNATQAQVNEATTALNEAILPARLKPQ